MTMNILYWTALKKIKNVRFYDTIPQSDYLQLMSICDIGIISLHPNLFIPCIPSKTIGYWAVKLPILALVDSLTDYGSYVIERSKSGLWSLSTDVQKTSALNPSKIFRLKLLRANLMDHYKFKMPPLPFSFVDK